MRSKYISALAALSLVSAPVLAADRPAAASLSLNNMPASARAGVPMTDENQLDSVYWIVGGLVVAAIIIIILISDDDDDNPSSP